MSGFGVAIGALLTALVPPDYVATRLAALAIGSAFLLADLGSPAKAFLAGMKPGTSWIARGFWIISIFMVLAFLHFVLHLFTEAGQTGGGRTLLNVIAILGIVFAVGTMAYTGILLGASKGIPFWRTGAVPVVFVVSALVTGHFTIMLGMAMLQDRGTAAAPLRVMALEAVVLVVVEVLAIFFFLQEAFRFPDARESAERILRKRMFVVGYFLLGLAVPVVLMIVGYRALAGADVLGWTIEFLRRTAARPLAQRPLAAVPRTWRPPGRARSGRSPVGRSRRDAAHRWKSVHIP